MKKIIRSSSLSLRFYVSDGWTKGELEECLEKGEIHMPYPDDASPYYILKVGGRFNVQKLLEKCSQLDRAFDDNPEMTDAEFLEQFNW